MMKLLFCTECGDVFNLQRILKQCSCGKVKGRYVDNESAVVNGAGYSLAIGNGALWQAIAAATHMKEDPRRGGDAWARHDGTIICWARPHTGPANPHTTIDAELCA